MAISSSRSLYIDLYDCDVCFFRFKNVLFEIHATPVSGMFDVNAKFMGVNMDKVQLCFQVSKKRINQNYYYMWVLLYYKGSGMNLADLFCFSFFSGSSSAPV